MGQGAEPGGVGTAPNAQNGQGKGRDVKRTGLLWDSSQVTKSGLLEDVTKLSHPGSISFKNLVTQLHIGWHRAMAMCLRVPCEWELTF